MNVLQKACADLTNLTLQGGRITKVAGKAASYAPHLIGCSGAALAVGLAAAGAALAPSAAQAGSCAETAPGSGEFECTGPTGADATQVIDQNGPITISTEPGFGITTASGNAFDIEIRGSSPADSSFTDNNASIITGARTGIEIRNRTQGALTVSSNGEITGVGRDGIDGRNDASATDFTIATNTVGGGRNGIRARQYGTGDLTITATGDVTGGSAPGIYSLHNGTGNLIINAQGTTTSASGRAIDARAGAQTTGLTLTANNTSGADEGIRVRHNGSGNAEVISTGTAIATAAGADAIDARAFALSNDLTITASDTQGGRDGIRARHYGSGALTVTSTGTATGVNRDGIDARAYATTTNLTVTANNLVGGRDGITARAYGSGFVLVEANGAVTGGRYGMDVRNFAGTDLAITAADVTGGGTGIRALNQGSGDITITATGTVKGATYGGVDYNGIYVSNTASGGDITITANNTSGAVNGILALQNGSGALTVTSIGTASGAARDGIDARNYNGTDLTVVAADLNAGRDGITARNYGSGFVLVDIAAGSVNATRDGTDVRNVNGTDLTLITGDVTGGRAGITARNYGSGDLIITANGTVGGAVRDGIYARNSASANDMTITAIDTAGGQRGIYADHRGTGALTITSTGTATGNSYPGIYALTSTASSDVVVTANNTTGVGEGIRVRHNGSGAVSVVSTGTATGLGTDSDGIDARNFSGTDLAITSNNASGERDGIRARHYGSGALTVTSTGTASGAERDGIDARNYTGTDLTVISADLNAGRDGITARHYGSGAVLVDTSAGTITATRDGTDVRNYNGTDLTLITGDVTGGRAGIGARHYGSGDLVITATGTVSAGLRDGIYALNSSDGSATTITAADTSGGLHGIYAVHNGSGALTITSTGTATGDTYAGIHALTSADSSDVVVTANNTTGVGEAIRVRHNGSGAASVVSTGTATGLGTDSDGIDARNFSGTDLAITSNNASGERDGIRARHYGSGALTVTSTGTASGAERDGIDARNYAGTDLTVISADLNAGRDGITARNYGSGAVLVDTSAGAITATRDGMDVRNFSGTDLTIIAGDINAERNGVRMRNYGSGSTTLTITGTIEGGSSDAVESDSAGPTTINLAGGAQIIAGSSGSALSDGGGNTTLNLGSGTAIVGIVDLGEGSDTININSASADISAARLSGGVLGTADNGWTNTLNFNDGWSGELAGNQVTNWNVINLHGGTLRFSSTLNADLLNVLDGGVLDASNGFRINGDLFIGAGSSMAAGNNEGTNTARVNGNLVNAGTIALREIGSNSAAGDVLRVDGDFTGIAGSTVSLDVIFDPTNRADLLQVRGDLLGTTTIVLNNVGAAGGNLTFGGGIRIVEVRGTAEQGALQLAGGNFDVGAFRYSLFQGGLDDPADQDFFLRSRARDIVMPTISAARVTQDAALTSIGTLHERVGEQEHLLRQTLESGFFTGAWARAIGRDYSDTARSASFGDGTTNGQFGSLQMGIDIFRGVTEGGSRTHIGVYGGLLWSGTTDRMERPVFMDAGQTNSDGWTAGFYLTHYAASGVYFDVVTQKQGIDHNASAADGTAFNANSDTWFTSVEIGKAFGTKWKIEPQAQLIYGTVSFDAFTDNRGVANQISIDDSVTARGGFRLKRTWDKRPDSAGGLFTIYGKANLWAQIDGGQTVLAIGASEPGNVDFREVWGEVGAGTTFSISSHAEFYADAEVQFGLDQGATAIAGRTGVRLRF